MAHCLSQAAGVAYVLFLRAHKKDFFRQAGHWKAEGRELNRRNILMGVDFYTHTPRKLNHCGFSVTSERLKVENSGMERLATGAGFEGFKF